MHFKALLILRPCDLVIDKGLVLLDVIEQCGNEHSEASGDDAMSEQHHHSPNRRGMLSFLFLR